MVRVNGREYSGKVMKNNDGVVVVVVYTAEELKDVFEAMTGATEVVEFSPSSNEEQIYPVTFTNSAKYISGNVYSIEFSTKASYKDEVNAMLQEQSDAIDNLLVMMLEA